MGSPSVASVNELPRPVETTASAYVFPASFAQQRLWLLDRLMPAGSVYNIEHVLRLAGEFDHSALRKAFNELIRRHEVLRTHFGIEDGLPVQMIEPESIVALAIEDLRDYPPEERESEARRRAQAEAETPFDLSGGPLIRLRLLQLARDEHWLLLTLHHIVTDGWSSGVLRREVTALYNAYHRGESSPLPELPVQYADYAVWQREWLQGAVLQPQLQFWREALAELPILDLPTDRPRPAVTSYRGGSIEIEVPEALTRSLKELSRREGVTLFMTLLAAYQILLFRHSGQEDIAVGVPTAGRTQSQLEDLIGFFVNTLVLRGDLSGEPSFRAYLAQVRARALDAYAHQDVPFEKLVEELAPKRDMSRNPLFQASLVLQNTPPGDWQLIGLEVQRVDGIRRGTAKFDLAMGLTESAGKLSGYLEYATDLFDAATIERMVGHWQTLLDGIVADPDCRIGELPLLTAEERRQLRVERDEPATDCPNDRCVHELFEAQAERRPHATALVFDNEHLTYGELNARANQLAHHLRSLGVGPDVLVGLCVERGPDLVVGLLGILKADGAYVPLDPDLPRERLAFMLEDTAVPVLVTQQTLLSRIPGRTKTVSLDGDRTALARYPASAPSARANASHLAYVIYTSGSTGKPKGVMVTHGNVARLFSATWHWFEFDEKDVWTCFHSCAFDFSVWEIWGALAHGGILVMVPYIVSRDPNAFHALLRREHVTVLNQTPSAFRQLAAVDARAGNTPDLALRLVIFGGEALEMRSLRPWLDRHGDAMPRLVNMYGITETTVHVTYRPIRRADVDESRGSMIGECIPDLRLRVLDRYLNPVPVGVPGEIVVGGAGVARGYLNRPELTAERFAPDPFGAYPGARLYRSGDLARRTANGDLEYLGRIDQQVKLRGFRIELGEIETAIARQPGVREAVVILREDVPGDSRLVAYVVPHGDAIAAADLRAWLKQQLPEYMIPAAFVHLRTLPVTSNGKLDRKSLPVPGSQSFAADDGFVAPHDAIEVQLMRIWEEMLGRYPVSVSDDYFELGGHSLLAIQIIERVNQLFGRDLPIDVLWHGGRTIGTLAAILRDRTMEGDPIWSHAVPIRPNGTRRPLFCAPVDGGHLFFYDNLARHLDPDQPVFGLPARGTDGREPPHTTIEAMAAHAIRLMRELQPAGPYDLLGYCSGGVVAFEMVRQLEAQGESATRLALVDSWAPRFSVRSWGNLLFPAERRRDWRMVQERVYQLVLHPLGLGRLRQFAKIGEAHRWALWSYRPKRIVGKAVLLRPSRLTRRPPDSALGWDQFVAAGVEVRVLSGQHGDLVKGSGAACLANELTKWLASSDCTRRADPRAGTGSAASVASGALD